MVDLLVSSGDHADAECCYTAGRIPLACSVWEASKQLLLAKVGARLADPESHESIARVRIAAGRRCTRIVLLFMFTCWCHSKQSLAKFYLRSYSCFHVIFMRNSCLQIIAIYLKLPSLIKAAYIQELNYIESTLTRIWEGETEGTHLGFHSSYQSNAPL